MPTGQTSITVTIVAHNDLIYAVQPSDRSIFRTVSLRVNPKTRNVRSVYHTFIDVIHFCRQKTFITEGEIVGQATSHDKEST
ncbi:unnamed protein product [Rotaria sp. Silwood1]|nr:unnamed protein product [Rotaria sp. Silwood1]CAF1665452.1 unnamed protein product [Rotaria sp. Silwood1]